MHRMDRLRRSLRDSFRRKRDGPESSKPHQWQADEEAVRAGNCAFHVKYLGCVEVFESRGMQVCEEAMKVLRASRRRPVKANLYVTGDGLRVVEDDTKGLIVDQTIEKVSFCAPDRNHERGFSYICRDGTTRRWMCHGFLATKDSGERMSHAVGCAFAVCLERKQKREKECGVTMTYDSKTSTFTRSGSFRVTSMTDSIGSNSSSVKSVDTSASNTTPRPAPVIATKAIERPHAPPKMLERQGSFRGFSQLANHSPFKRQLSLRLNELPSNLQRTQQNNINIFGTPNGANSNMPVQAAHANNIIPTSVPPSSVSPAPPPRTQRHRLHSLPGSSFTAGGTIPEASSSSNTSSEINLSSSSSKIEINNKDLVSELCQQVTQGLSLLAANHDESKTNGFTISSTTASSNASNKFPTKFTNPWDDGEESSGSTSTSSALPVFNTAALSTANSLISKPTPVTKTFIPVSTSKPTIADSWMNNLTQNHEPKAPLQSKISPIKENIPVKSPVTSSSNVASRNIYEPLNNPTPISNAASITSTTVTSNNVNNLVQNKPGNNNISTRPAAGMNYRGGPTRSQSLGADPFDADWAAPLARTGQAPTNPFSRQQTFQVSM